MLLQSRKVAPHSCSPKLLFGVATESRVPKKLRQTPNSKAAPRSCLSSPKRLPKAILQSDTRKLHPKVATENCSPKLLLQTWDSSNLCPKAAPQSYSAKRLPKASCHWKLLLLPKVACKAAPESCPPKLLFFKAIVPQNCSGKFAKDAPQAVPRSCFPKLLPKAPLQSGCPKAATPQRYSPNRLPKAALFTKTAPQSYSAKRPPRKLCPKVATESCSPKLSVTLPPKAAPQNCCSSKQLLCKVVKAAPQSCSQSCSPKLLPPKRFPRSCFLKLFPKAPSGCPKAGGYASNLFPKSAPQTYAPKRLPKAAPQSCCRKLPPKVASQRSLIPKAAVFKAAVRSCRAKLLLKAAPSSQGCSPKLLHKAFSQSRSPKLLSKAAVFKAAVRSCRAKLLLKAAPSSQGCSPKLLHKAFSQSRSPKLLSKAAPNICSPKLLKLSQSGFLKLLPKAVVLQSNCSSMLQQSRKVAPHNCSPKLFSKVATESRVPKKLPKTARTG